MILAFGDMGQTARLRLIHDRCIAGHSSCELRRHLDSVPPETPIRDVVDRCRVWESHADPAVRRVNKPSPDPIYPAYVVGDSDNISDTTQVAAVTRSRSVTDDRQYPSSDTGSACSGEVVTASGGRDTESPVAGCESSGVGGIRENATVIPLWTTANTAATSTHPTRLERRCLFLMWEVGSCCDSRVLDVALDGGLAKGDGGLRFGPDRDITLSEIPHTTRNDDLVLGAPVPLPAENVGRVALSPADGRLRAGDVNTNGNITTGLQCWNTEGDVLDQYETFNGMPVYYGGDMYDSEDSDWDDPYALVSAAYVEDYNFDVPDGMDLMVHRHSRDLDSLDVQQDCQTDVAPVCQTVSYVTWDEWDTIDDDSLAEATDADGPNMDEFYQQVVSSDDEDFVISDNGSVADLDRDISDEEDCCDSDDRDMSEEEDFVTSDDGSLADLDRVISDEDDCGDSDVGSVADLQWDTWADACTLAFQGSFPPEAAEIRPAVVFRNSLFPRDECANAVVSARREVPMPPVLQVTSTGGCYDSPCYGSTCSTDG